MNEKVKTLKEVDEINEFFASHKDRGVQLWRYDISHSCLELVMMHEGEIHWTNSTAKYTAVFCHMTHSMMIPAITWRARLAAIESRPNEKGETTITLMDQSNGFKVECNHLFLSVGRHPNTPTYPILNGPGG
jgi:hypothetical protein